MNKMASARTPFSLRLKCSLQTRVQSADNQLFRFLHTDIRKQGAPTPVTLWSSALNASWLFFKGVSRRLIGPTLRVIRTCSSAGVRMRWRMIMS